MTHVTLSQVAKNVPIYGVFIDGYDCGCLTVFSGEGPMATFRHYGTKVTVKGATIHECLVNVKDAVDQIDADRAYVEDEDGDRAFARMLERRCESHYPEEYGEPF